MAEVQEIICRSKGINMPTPTRSPPGPEYANFFVRFLYTFMFRVKLHKQRQDPGYLIQKG